MTSLRSRAFLPALGVLAAAAFSVMPLLSRALRPAPPQGPQHLVGGGTGRGDARGDADPVVGGTAHGEARQLGDVLTDARHAADVSDRVLRQASVPPGHPGRD